MKKICMIVFLAGIFILFSNSVRGVLLDSLDYNPFNVSKEKITYTHTFADGIIGWENFSVSFKDGLVASYLDNNVTLKAFVESNTGVRQNITLSSLNLPFRRISNTQYKYNMSFNISQSVKYAGFYFDTNFKPDIKVEENAVRIGDGESFDFIFDFSDAGLNYTLDEKELKINVQGLSKVEIDPTVTFETNDAENVALANFDEHTFGLVWCDETNDDIYYKVYDTNGTNTTTTITIDAATGGCLEYAWGVDIDIFDSTNAIICYTDITDTDVYFTVYNKTGSQIVAPTDVDAGTTANSNGGCSVSTHNSTHFGIAFSDNTNNDISIDIDNFDGSTVTVVTNGIDVDTATSYASTDVLDYYAYNSTNGVISWYNSTSTGIQLALVSTLGTVVQLGAADTDCTGAVIGCGMSVIALDDSTFIVGWADTQTVTASRLSIWNQTSVVNDTISVWTISDASTISPPKVSAINSTHFVYAGRNTTAYLFSIYNNLGVEVVNDINIGATYASSENIFAWSKSIARNSGFCNDNFVYAFCGTGGNWTSYQPNGTAWDGTCPSVSDSTPPTFSNYNANTTIAGNPVNFSIVISDETALSGYIFETNNSGVLENYTWTSLASGGTAYNATTLNSTIGTLINVTFYANDSSNNWATYRASLITTAAGTCTYSSGNWNVNCTENCQITSAVSGGGNSLYFSGAGWFTVNANIINFKNIYISNGCKIVIGSGRQFW